MKKCFLVLLLLIMAVFVLINARNKPAPPQKTYREISVESDFSIDHIFMITIDTLRADHLGCYGYPRNTSEFIDSMAAKGVLFEKAYSLSASTAPSHASIFTGMYPSQHRVMANGHQLRDSYTTLAEILHENDFNTIAFTSTDRHFYRSKINQGFDHYEEPIDTVAMFGYKYRLAALTVDTAIDYLSNNAVENKLFFWVHLFDPHQPYHPPAECYERIEKDIPKSSFM